MRLRFVVARLMFCDVFFIFTPTVHRHKHRASKVFLRVRVAPVQNVCNFTCAGFGKLKTLRCASRFVVIDTLYILTLCTHTEAHIIDLCSHILNFVSVRICDAKNTSNSTQNPAPSHHPAFRVCCLRMHMCRCRCSVSMRV